MKNRQPNRRPDKPLTFVRTVGTLFLCGWVAVSCSTTKHLPEGEQLYTGIKHIEVADDDKSRAGGAALTEATAALEFPPNNALFGSSSKRFPMPVGLWFYSGFVNKKGKVNEWIFRKFASKPVTASTVNPDVRVAVARNILRENGYFDGTASYELVPDKKDERKTQIAYHLEMNHLYTLDSIRFTAMRQRTDSLIVDYKHESLLRKGDPFSVTKLEDERQRIATLLRNNGFYYFRPDFIVYEADTLLTPGKIWLRMTRKQGVPPSALRAWKIGDVSVRLNGYNNEPPTDSIRYKDMTIHYEGKLRVRPSVLYNRFYLRPGDLYSQEKLQKTQTGLSRLGIFQYTEMLFAPRDTSRRNERIDMQLNAVYDLPYDGELELNVKNKSNDYAGPGAIFSVTRRNIFRGGETFGVQARGSYEWQTGSASGTDGKINSYEFGLSSTLTFPSVLFPGFANRNLDYPSSTTARIYANQMNRAGYFKMLSFGGNFTYDFQPTATSTHSFTPFRLEFNLLQDQTAKFDTIMAKNPAVYESLKNQFIPAMSYTYRYDDSPNTSLNNHIWWENTLTQAGNIVSGLYAAAGQDFNQKEKKLLGNPFAQFVKGTSEFRYNYRIDKNNWLVGRVSAGAIYSYGNAEFSPYKEQFYVGGANSIRAFTVRSIGPGSYKSDEDDIYAFIDQTGDIKLEANLEYRFRILGNLHGATFLDCGNVWLFRDDPDRPGGTLKASRFLKDLALGTGAGIRYDMGFLVVRLDVGIGLHVPYETSKSGYFNIYNYSKQGIGWHLAIGYPF